MRIAVAILVAGLSSANLSGQSQTSPAAADLVARLGGSSQTAPANRVIVVLLDDGRAPIDTVNTRRVLGIIRNEVLGATDLIGVVSTGQSSILYDVSYDPGHRRFDAAAQRAEAAWAAPAGQVPTDETRARTAYLTARDIIAKMAAVANRPTLLIVLSSDDYFARLRDEQRAGTLDTALTGTADAVAAARADLRRALAKSRTTMAVVNPATVAR